MNFFIGRIIKHDGKFYFDEGTFKVKLVEDTVPKTKPYEGDEVIFGIRPEDIYDKLFVQEASTENTVTARVDVVEPMGSEVYLHMATPKQIFIARVGGHDKPEVNHDIDLVFDMSKAHFFDKDTEKVIV